MALHPFPPIERVIRMMTRVADRSAMDGRLNGRAKSSITAGQVCPDSPRRS
jgi:hypothetical protein